MRKKGVSEILALAFVTAIVLTGATLVLTIGMPAINRAKESAVISEATQNMRILDSLIREVASEGVGALRTVQLRVSDGKYRVDPVSSSLDFELDLKSDYLPRGTYLKEGNVISVVGGTTKTSKNSTHLTIENDVLQVTFRNIGTNSNFDGVNTSTFLSSVKLKTTGDTLTVSDSKTQLGNVSNTSVGVGYSKLVQEGDNLPRAEVLLHIRSNYTSHEYEVLYTLPTDADFFVVTVRNVSLNLTALNYGYKFGSSTRDVVRTGNAEGINATESCYLRAALPRLFICSFDNTQMTQTSASGLVYSGDENNFDRICSGNTTAGNDATGYYRFNVTSNGPLRAVIPLMIGDCNTIGNATEVIANEGLPSSPFNTTSSSGQKKLQISIQNPRIKIWGTVGGFSTGTYRFCVQKTGQEAGRAIVNVTAC